MNIEQIIESKKRRRTELLEKMIHELSRMKSSIDDYKVKIKKELDTSEYINEKYAHDVIHRRDEWKWIEYHHQQFLHARQELLEEKAYLLAHYDTKTKDCK